ncbi:DNA-binding transcriptional regulator, MocR family, contains an aminotransferase domain [Streptoalloteichus tenebrarius]|uniref:DNA-binding transcriptional regulator, MocR family, contains an aminotransferase domain n=1 Tax=Streptoalloteichus tenebrarius (strain ATCC 17920 / DSM 40477 / JCM 4838 / CBS 697.72 / NBRC 16177 / NCIMB 11028 / NRRL B-12390 / A12253. 1 / ISP 5477) TaxID=1933 RepID=A0ABT1HV19_STRSD|nr:PLP-dependent aminotransferase family protein [Streptoalloteichus tenebrarius]MCP2259265.1 DNA-binding transcriptional regulator, MocR family, contains an aminotransferase domain [Streptoalloteichus tenebrarius]BFE99024.1 PLP-dependent aminotransferase family protein [Streptoalloteichus tenebrarius]
MDQNLGWWVRVALDGWRDRPGPRYRRIAASVVSAVERGLATTGDRLPPERSLADALRVSRGTVVRAFEELTAAGVVNRVQGSGTFVRATPGWTDTPKENPASTLLRRQMDLGGEAIDLSQAVPAGVDHLPAVAGLDLLAGVTGHGLHPAGIPELRTAIAEYLGEHLRLPTVPEQVIVTSGVQHALALVATAVVAAGRTVITGCPTHGGLAGALAGRGGRILGVPADELGIDAHAARHAAAHVPAPVLYVEPGGSDPTGAVLSRSRRQALLHVARRSGASVVENLAQANLDLRPGAEAVVPLAAEDESVIVVGSLSKVLWAGLRVGWVRSPAPLCGHLLRLRSAHDRAPSVPAQILATRLLRAVDDRWLNGLRAALRERRDLLLALLQRHLPAWHVEPPASGLALWATLPVTDSETYAHLAARYGAIVAPGATHCVDRRHHNGVRLSFAESPHVLEAAVDRLAAAWEHHTRDLAASR